MTKIAEREMIARMAVGTVADWYVLTPFQKEQAMRRADRIIERLRAPVDPPYTKTARARFCNQAGPMGGGCEDSWHVGGNYGSHVCRNPNHHDTKPVDPPERVSKQEAGGSIREGVVRGWIVGCGFDDGSETHSEYEITDRKPPGPDDAWLKVTLIVGDWVGRVGSANSCRSVSEASALDIVDLALEAAYDVLDEVHGCDCGTDEPGTCALCLVEEAIAARRTLEDTKGEE